LIAYFAVHDQRALQKITQPINHFDECVRGKTHEITTNLNSAYCDYPGGSAASEERLICES